MSNSLATVQQSQILRFVAKKCREYNHIGIAFQPAHEELCYLDSASVFLTRRKTQEKRCILVGHSVGRPNAVPMKAAPSQQQASACKQRSSALMFLHQLYQIQSWCCHERIRNSNNFQSHMKCLKCITSFQTNDSRRPCSHQRQESLLST